MKPKHALVIILVIASVLRLLWLDRVPVSLFGDELEVGYQAYSILQTGRDYYGNFMPLHFHSLAEWRTPLYLYTSVPTVALFGISPLGVRLPAALFGIAGVWMLYLLVRVVTKEERLSLLSAMVLALSPWHIQYSRAAFEVTELLFFLLLGLWAFYKSLKNGRWFWVSLTSFALLPWIYSTAKFFTPFLIVFLTFFYRKEILALPRRQTFLGVLALLIVGAPIAYSTIFGGGTERFSYISVFTDPTTEPEVGTARLTDARVRGEMGEGLSPTFADRLLHNKFVFWAGKVSNNYINAFSTEFLFVRGDPNLRHSIQGMGQFYKVEALALVLGVIFFFSRKRDTRWKFLIVFWILAGILPASITRDGGNHASRLILILPPLVLLIAYGLYESYLRLRGKVIGIFAISLYIGVFLIGFINYQHNYWVHNPLYSERWWHAGFEGAIDGIKEYEDEYERIVISTSNEPPWVFFAAWYQFPPRQWQENFPIDNVVALKGFGEVSHIDKYYFGTIEGQDVYSWGKVLDSRTLYVATEKEVKVNLIAEPQRVPKDLVLVKSVPYPSGEPAFYLFSGKNEAD